MASNGGRNASLDRAIFEQIGELRIRRPGLVESEARRRKRRLRMAPDGKLVMVALDHPARGINSIRGDALAMGDRFEYLARARRVLADPDLDGVLASPDVMEELFLMNYAERRRGGNGFLDGRVLVGSMNRGGLAGTSFEMEDAFTGFTARRLEDLRLDGGKMLWRVDRRDPAAGRTMLACAVAMNELHHRRLAIFLEPLAVERRGDDYVVLRDPATLVRQCGIAAGLSESSLNVWLKLPIGEDLARVGRSTTLPILLLGGPASDDAEAMAADFAAGLSSSAQVRGAIIGRNLLFPGDRDPYRMSRALTALVHRGATLKEAIRLMSNGS
ncbi:MAG: hypothetical protein KGM47_16685 [Acidobacteriota bacterium]|nr:hypothetical protein [Acidobacteriota bacterium]